MDSSGGKVRRKDLLFPEESYDIKGACIAVHESLGFLVNFGKEHFAFDRVVFTE